MVASPSAAPGLTIPISQEPRLNQQPEGVAPARRPLRHGWRQPVPRAHNAPARCVNAG
jgi:hypothetical protein